MLKYVILIFASFLVVSCAGKKVVSAGPENRENTEFAIPLDGLKKSVIAHALYQFKKDIEENKIQEEEITLRDHPFRFHGKIRAPLLSENANFELLEKEYGKRTLENTGPVDIIDETPAHFLMIYRQTIFEGRGIAENRSVLKVSHSPDFKPLVEEVRTKNSALKGPLWFESFIIDFDKAFKEAKRDLKSETEIFEETATKG